MLMGFLMIPVTASDDESEDEEPLQPWLVPAAGDMQYEPRWADEEDYIVDFSSSLTTCSWLLRTWPI